MKIPDTPYRFNCRSLPVRRSRPRLGEHNREVLAEIGVTGAEIDTTLGDTEESNA